MRTPHRRSPPRRVPPRAARRALTPTPPKGVQLVLAQALRRVAGAVERAILDELEPHLAAFAAPEPEARTDADPPASPSAKVLLANIRGRVKGILDATRAELEAASSTAGKRALEHSKKEFDRLGINLLKDEPSLDPKIKAWRRQNIDLIVSLTKRKVARVGTLLENEAGMRVETLRDAIQESVGATKSQAALIARDQVLKLNSQITETRHAAAGITEYVWTCSGDERVRGKPGGIYPDAKPSHWELDGKRFKYSDPPISGSNGRRGHPGTMFQCRCTAYPILPELEAEGLS